MAYETVAYSKDDRIAKVSFCRPKVHNAFNSTVIAEMADVFRRIAADDEIRVVVITGEGKSFCAGADLNWMRGVISQSFEENLVESNDLADLFWQIYTCKRPVIGKINGAAIGGGTGFVAVCDLAIAGRSAVFSFSEVKIGVVPACIGPYVIKRMGEGITLHHAAALIPQQRQILPDGVHGAPLAVDKAHRGGATGERLQPQRAAAGKEVEAACPVDQGLQPVEEGLTHPVSGGSQPFDIGKVEFTTAPLAADDAQLVAAPFCHPLPLFADGNEHHPVGVDAALEGVMDLLNGDRIDPLDEAIQVVER